MKLFSKIFTVLVLGLAMNAGAQDVIFAESSVQEGFTGLHVIKNESGVKTATYEFKNGVPDGAVSFFGADGSLVEKGFFKKGKKDGSWEKFVGSNKISTAQYFKGKKDGNWKIYDTTGVLRYDMHFEKGKKVGVWKMYDESGKLINEKEY